MCGIAAIFSYNGGPPVDRDELIRVRDHLSARGPDGVGEWISGDRRVGLAHRRLSIIDLSEAGAQPMWNAERTLGIVYNGEIYNYGALRSGLQERGGTFASHSDTEVLLKLYAEKGADMLHDIRGMYAFAIWDAARRTLFLARDPFGIKPLYYASDGRSIRVASQVKALAHSSPVDTTPDPAGHVGFFVWGAVPDPFTLFRGISALPAGHTLTVREGEQPRLQSFCSPAAILESSEISPPELNAEERREILHTALHDSVEHHLVADVPVGLFLSAGIDSCSLAALVGESHPDVRSVTLGFEEYRGTPQDETLLAEAMARRSHTNHRTIWVTREDFEAQTDKLFSAMDQPSIDGVNTYFVSYAARRDGLKVALSGLGGDELFAGYPGFRELPRLVRLMNAVKPLTRAGRLLRRISSGAIKRFTSPKYAGLFEYGADYPGAYLLRRGLFMPWELPAVLDPDFAREGWIRLNTLGELGRLSDGLQNPRLKVSSLELGWYMRHQLLRDSDWAGMAHSLEIRVPLVDLPLLKQLAPLLAARHPPMKQELASAPEPPLPDEIVTRPKTGFTVPVRDWLMKAAHPGAPAPRGLRGWAREVYARFANPLEMHGRTMRLRARRRPGGSPVQGSGNSRRILMLLTDAFGGSGGIAKFNRDFLSALCSRQGTKVTAIPRMMPNDPEEMPANLEWLSEGLGGKKRFVKAVIQKARELRSSDKSGDQPLIFCGHIHLLPVAALAKRLTGGTLYLILHGIDAWRPAKSPVLRASLRAVDGFIAVSSVTKERFERWSHLRFDQGIVLPNCVDLDALTPGAKPSSLIDRYRLSHRKVLMTLGRLSADERYKGFDEVLELLPRLAKEHPGICYLICGEGSDRIRLVEKARSLDCDVIDFAAGDSEAQPEPATAHPVRPLVVFTGRISDQEKVDHYRVADLYVMPGSGEGFGVVYLEALACGIPVIGSKIDGSRDALREGRLGLLVDPRNPEEILNAILQVLGGASGFRPGSRPPGIDFFSATRFRERVHEILDAISPVPTESGHAARPNLPSTCLHLPLK